MCVTFHLLSPTCQSIPAFTDVVLLQTPEADQIFSLNTRLFSSLSPERSTDRWTRFLLLSSPLKLVPPPTPVLDILRWLHSQLSHSSNSSGLSDLEDQSNKSVLVLPSSDIPSAEVLISLAGVLLEYPIAYVLPSSTTGSHLSGEELDFFDVGYHAFSSPSSGLLASV